MDIKPTVLLLADWYHPGFKAGGPIQSCVNLVNALGNDFSFHVLTSNKDLGALKPYPGIKSNEWVDGSFGEKVYYADRHKITSARIRAALQSTGATIVYLNSMFSARFTILPLLALSGRSSQLKIVLAPRGMLQRGALTFKPYKKRMFLLVMRLLKLHRRVVFHATDEQEQKDIGHFFPKNEIVLAGNIPAAHIAFQTNASKEPGSLKLLFFSRLHPKKNLDYFLSILKMERFQGRIELDVLGDAASEEYLSLCKQIARSLPPNVTVNFHGGIPQEMAIKKMGSYHAFILPTLGENFGHSIFEALMAGLPVLISDQTPWRNLADSTAGWDVPLDQPAVFAEKLRQLIAMDNHTHQEWKKGARRLAEKYREKTDFKMKYLQLFS